MATYFCLSDFSFVVYLVSFGVCGVLGTNQCPTECICLGDMVSCESIGLEYVPNDLPIWSTSLYLTDNKIKKLSSDNLRGLESLQEIDLSDNEIESIDSDAFSGLPNLKKVVLSYNNLEELTIVTENLSITELVISHNRFRAIDVTSLGHLKELRHLELSYNRLTELSVKFPVLPNLNELSLNNNRITSVGNGTFDNLTNLVCLRLAKNQISTLPKDTFTHLTNLKQLELSKNKLTSIDGLTFSGLGKLETLRLKRNNLTQLKDGCFYGLDNIQELELDNNNISMVNKSWLYGLNSVNKLSMTFNNIRQIEVDAWDYCPNLQELDLSHNALTYMNMDSFSHLSKLDSLGLSDNKIAHIAQDTFKDMTSLTSLNLNSNEISWSLEDRGGAFEGLVALTTLSVETNRIQSINADAFSGLSQLVVLRMAHNNISTVHHAAFDQLTALQQLHFNTSTLLCDCNLAWLPTWLEEHEFKVTAQGTCSHPVTLRSNSVYEVSQELFVCERSEYLKPLMVTEPEDMIALKGQSVRLHCSAASSSTSPMTVHWRKDNSPVLAIQINTSASMLDEVICMTSELVIHNAQDEDSGLYQCMAVNEVGKTYSNKARINVHVYPIFTKKPKDVTVKSSQFAILECAASGQPDPEISWQKDGGEDFPAARERRMQVRANDEFMISNVKLEDQGVYTCTATNAAGTIMTNATFNVLEPPKFAEQMVDQTVYAPETAVLECMAQGSPQPTVVWLKDEEELKMTERHFFTAENQLLVIVEAKPSDSGRYTCQMTNTLGMKSDSMWLDVNAPRGGAGVGIFTGNTTTTGIIIIAVVCCVVGTSLIWVVIIYQTRRKNEEYSATPTEETTVPEGTYQAVDKNGKPTALYPAPNGQRYSSLGQVYPNGISQSSQPRQIALADGIHVTYDNGLRVTHNPHADYDWPGEYQLPNGQITTTVEHHGSESSNSIQKDPISSEEYSHSSQSTSTSSPGTHSTQSTTILSTFQPYPTSPTSPDAYQPHIISPTSPHNISTQPLLSEDHCSTSPIRQSQSQEYGFLHGPKPPLVQGAQHPPLIQSQPDCYATFPRQQAHPHVHKASSCSHLQSPGCTQQRQQSLSALPEDPSQTHRPHTKRSRSNYNVKQPDEHLYPLPPPPPTPPERRQSLEVVKQESKPRAKSPVDQERRTQFAKQFLKLTPSGDLNSIANECDSHVPSPQRMRINSNTGINKNSGESSTLIPPQNSSVKNGTGIAQMSNVNGLLPLQQTASQMHNGVEKQLPNGHAAFMSHDDNKQSPVVSL